MEKLYANYHTHTYRCGHALGSDESYVEGAIEIGLKALGFTDHISFKNYSFPGMRQERSQLEDYVSSIHALKEKYKDKIEIHVGFEAEYIEEFIDDYRDLLLNHEIEYLICGQHCQLFNGVQDWYNAHHHDKEYVTKYVDDVIKAMKSGLFSYLAHPDHFMNGYRDWDDFTIAQSRRIIEASIQYDVPLEINVAGIRFAEYKHKTNGNGDPVENYYPYPLFWDLVSSYKAAKVIIGIDAHRKEDFLDGEEKEALKFAKEHHIQLMEKVKFKKIKQVKNGK